MANIAIIILAAGNSSRMGRPKQFLDFGGKPLIRHAVDIALASQARPAVVVCGEAEAEIRQALHGLAVTFAPNPHWEGGMGTSIQAGLRMLGETDGAILTLADMPLLTVAIYDGLIEQHLASGKPIVTAAYADTVGVPVLFARQHFAALLGLKPAQGCKGVILAHETDALRVACPEAEVDVDTVADYQRALQSLTAE